MASDCAPRWHHEAAYLRFIHGFVQSAPQLVLQCVIVLKGVHIHSLHQTVEAIQSALKEENVSVIQALLALTAEKPLRWFWGLIQVHIQALQTSATFISSIFGPTICSSSSYVILN